MAARGVTAASFPRQEDAKGKKPKRREKLKRRGKAEGEQSAPEESGPGDGGLLQPPSAKKAKKSAEGNGAAEQNGSAPASGHGEAPAAEEPGSDAEVTAVRGAARAAPRARQCPAAPGSRRLLSLLSFRSPSADGADSQLFSCGCTGYAT